MTATLGRWRATYTPGEWVVLSGPTSLVLLEPPTHEWASLINTLWDEVVASSSIVDLAARLAHFKIDELPSLAAFFWTEEGMRSLIRGGISVIDLGTGKVVADGEGIQTWSEVGLGGVKHIRVDVPHEGDATLLELPLVVGAVRASSITLDASDQVQVSSPQRSSTPDEVALADRPKSTIGSAAPIEPDSTTDPLAEAPLLEAVPALSTEPAGDGVGVAGDPPVDQTAELSAEEIAAISNAETELMPPPFAQPQSPAESVAGAPQQLEAAVGPQLAEDPADAFARAVPPTSGDSPAEADIQDSAILAVLCPNGHASPPSATSCRICGGPVGTQGPQFVAYPVVAVLRASDGTSAELDRPVLIGRAPSPDRSSSRAPRLMTVPSPNHDISRTHLEVAPDDWQIVVTDLNSTNGTILVRPGRGDPQQLAPGEPVPVPVGSVMELGDGVSVLIDFPQ
jgi:FHA domain